MTSGGWSVGPLKAAVLHRRGHLTPKIRHPRYCIFKGRTTGHPYAVCVAVGDSSRLFLLYGGTYVCALPGLASRQETFSGKTGMCWTSQFVWFINLWSVTRTHLNPGFRHICLWWSKLYVYYIDGGTYVLHIYSYYRFTNYQTQNNLLINYFNNSATISTSAVVKSK